MQVDNRSIDWNLLASVGAKRLQSADLLLDSAGLPPDDVQAAETKRQVPTRPFIYTDGLLQSPTHASALHSFAPAECVSGGTGPRAVLLQFVCHCTNERRARLLGRISVCACLSGAEGA